MIDQVIMTIQGGSSAAGFLRSLPGLIPGTSNHCIIILMVTVKIKGTTCCLYNVYTVVTTSYGITAVTRQIYHRQGTYTTAGQLYHGKVQGVVYIVQATYTIALLNCTLEAHI